MSKLLRDLRFLACALLMLAVPQDRTQGVQGPLRFSGTFVQYQEELQGWSPETWISVLDKMKEVGMDTVIVQMLVRENADGTLHTFIGPSGSPDATETILRYSETNGFKVFLGLYLPSWNHDMTGSNFLVEAQARMAAVAQQAWDRYFGPAGPRRSFAGWYIPYEPWTADYTADELQRLHSFFRGIHDACALISGEVPLAISPFINSTRPPPCRVEELYGRLLDQSGISILLLQDSVGAQQWNTSIREHVAPYFRALQNACAARGVRLWGNLESFQITNNVFAPCDVGRLRKQFDAAAPFVESFVTFDFVHYMNPVAFLSTWDPLRRARMQQLFSDYRESFVSTDYAPGRRPEIRAVLENGSLNLAWSGSVGDSFLVQSTVSLGSQWENANLEVLTNGDSFSATDPKLAQSSSCFYRVQRLPRLIVPECMVRIPPGTFVMGTPDSDPARSTNELSQFQASFSREFWISQMEATQSEYQNLMCTNPARFKGDLERPIEAVSYGDAMEYCGRLTAEERGAGRLPEGYVYRLPTEAEWEYAARAGSTNFYFFGDDPSVMGTYGWYSANSQGSPHPGGLLQPNAWKLHDTCGNVYEWCLDWIESPPVGSVLDFRGSTNGAVLAVRGGAWGFKADQCRSSWRRSYPAGVRYATLGFRVVLAPVP